MIDNYNEISEHQLTKLKVERQKLPTTAEKLESTKEEIKKTQHKIKELKANKYKSDSENAELKELQGKLSDLKVSKAKLQKKVDNAKNNAIIHAAKKKSAERKQEAINKVLEEEGLHTENGVKGLIALRHTVLRYGVKTNNELAACLDFIKQNAPHLLNNDQ